MRYRNDDPMAAVAMNRDRCREPDEEYYEEEQCPVCGTYEPLKFYLNDDDECVGCTSCLREETYLGGV